MALTTCLYYMNSCHSSIPTFIFWYGIPSNITKGIFWCEITSDITNKYFVVKYSSTHKTRFLIKNLPTEPLLLMYIIKYKLNDLMVLSKRLVVFNKWLKSTTASFMLIRRKWNMMWIYKDASYYYILVNVCLFVCPHPCLKKFFFHFAPNFFGGSKKYWCAKMSVTSKPVNLDGWNFSCGLLRYTGIHTVHSHIYALMHLCTHTHTLWDTHTAQMSIRHDFNSKDCRNCLTIDVNK